MRDWPRRCPWLQHEMAMRGGNTGPLGAAIVRSGRTGCCLGTLRGPSASRAAWGDGEWG